MKVIHSLAHWPISTQSWSLCHQHIQNPHSFLDKCALTHNNSWRGAVSEWVGCHKLNAALGGSVWLALSAAGGWEYLLQLQQMAYAQFICTWYRLLVIHALFISVNNNNKRDLRRPNRALSLWQAVAITHCGNRFGFLHMGEMQDMPYCLFCNSDSIHVMQKALLWCTLQVWGTGSAVKLGKSLIMEMKTYAIVF